MTGLLSILWSLTVISATRPRPSPDSKSKRFCYLLELVLACMLNYMKKRKVENLSLKLFLVLHFKCSLLHQSIFTINFPISAAPSLAPIFRSHDSSYFLFFTTLAITLLLFLSRLKIYLFHKFFQP